MSEKKQGKNSRNKKLKRIIAVAVVLIVLVGAFFWWKNKNATPVVAQSNLTEFTVARGSVTKTVSGSGSVEPVKTYTVATKLTGDIMEDYFEEGDEVAKDAVLYLLDEASTSLNMDQAEENVDTAQDSYNDALEALHDLTAYTKQSGVITALFVSKGDQVSSNTKVAEVTDSSRMLLTVPFNSNDAQNFRAGDAATVYLEDYNLTLGGTVQKVGSGQSVSSTNALVTYVEIVFANPGAMSAGGYGTAIVGDYACNDEGLVTYANVDILYASGSGKITTLYVKEGDNVERGAKILTVENSSVEDTVTRARKTLTDAQKKLTETRDNLEITSPIAGTVIAKNSKAGDTLYSDSTTMAVVADMSRLLFTIEVDELEIRYLQVGQTAVVTADAYENEVYTGVVTNVGKTGTASSGVTTYSVKIEIEEYGDLLPGMNVDAEIVIESVHDVLFVPIDAVQRGNMVLVKGSGGQSEGFMGAQAPAGYVYTQVETGVSGNDYVEIKSGLNEGDVIGYTPATNSGGGDGFFMMGPGGGGGGAVMMTTGPGGGQARQAVPGGGG